MTEANASQLKAGGDSIGDPELREQIRNIKILRLLFALPSDPSAVMEHAPEHDADPDYQFSIVVSRVCEALQLSEEEAASTLFVFGERSYVSLLSQGGKSVSEQFIQDAGNFEKIHLSLNKQKILEALLDASGLFGERLESLIDLSGQLDALQVSYEKNSAQIFNDMQEIRDIKINVALIQKKLEEARDNNLEAMKKQAESLTSDAKKTAEETAKETAKTTAKTTADDEINKALKVEGNIGKTLHEMQTNMIQYMGIFVAIFALIGLTSGHSDSWSVVNLFYMNLLTTASMATLLLFVSAITNAEESRTSFLAIMTVILWITAVFTIFVFPGYGC